MIMMRIGWLLAAACVTRDPLELRAVELPRLFPDYIGVTLPPNIAPLNFKIQEPAAAYRVELRSTKGPPIVISSPNPTIRIPPKAWASLLRANLGQPFYWDISARATSSGWMRFATVTNQIAREEIDGWLAYRLLKPIFNYYTHLGIYQRNLASFDQRLILEQDEYNDSCLNCHTPLNRSPNTFAFNIRASGGKNPMILVISATNPSAWRRPWATWPGTRAAGCSPSRLTSFPSSFIPAVKPAMSLMPSRYLGIYRVQFQHRRLSTGDCRARPQRDLAHLVTRWAVPLFQQRQSSAARKIPAASVRPDASQLRHRNRPMGAA